LSGGIDNKEGMMNNLVVFGNSQQEFWRREFQAKILPKSGNYLSEIQKLIDAGIRPIVQIGQNCEEIVELQEFPKNSLIVHLYADETYQINNNIKLIRLPAAYKILRSYPIPRIQIFSILFSVTSSFLDVFNSSNQLSMKKLIRYWAAGTVMASRQILIKSLENAYRRQSISFLLGYTDIFCKSYISSVENRFGEVIDDGTSLFSIGGRTIAKIIDGKEFDLSFVGQRGNIVREIAVDQSLRIKDSRIIIRDKFGGNLGFNGSTIDTGIEYLEVMLNSRFTLCPPGNYSGYSFRIMESLICGTYPIVNNYPLTDPFFTSPIQVLQTTRTPKSWKALISSIVEKDEADVNQNVEIGRFFLEKEVNNLLLQLKVLKSTRG
jgi:hypothetical protein